MRREDGPEWQSGSGRYANLKVSDGPHVIDDGFYVYEPEVLLKRSSHVTAQASPPAIEDDGSMFTKAFLRRGVKQEVTQPSVLDRVRKRQAEVARHPEQAQKAQRTVDPNPETQLQRDSKRNAEQAALAYAEGCTVKRYRLRSKGPVNRG